MDPERPPSIRRSRLSWLLAAPLIAAQGVWASGVPLQRANAAAGTVCRTYSTAETRVSSGPTVKGTMQIKCNYNLTTNEYVCHQDYSGASSYSLVQTTQFASVADFVGDPSKVSFFTHAKAVVVKFPGATSTQSYSYDGRGYLTSIATASTAGAGGSTVQKFTAWDPLGRPIAGRDEVQDFVYTYDDAQRVFTMTSRGTGSVITLKFDANGNHLSSTTTSPTFKDTTTITVHSTEQICR